MFQLAMRNLRHARGRLALSVGGVGLALTLILALDAIFAGTEQRISAYIDNSSADIWVAQAGVRNLHMAASALPADAVQSVERIPGVADVTPILYLTNRVEVGSRRNLAYVIGLPSSAASGRPWVVSQGDEVPGRGEAIVDRAVAEGAGIGLGDEVAILGLPLVVTGLTEGTATITNSIAYIAYEDFAALRGGDSPSFLLVTVDAAVQPAAIAAEIEAVVPGVTAQTREAFAASERQVVRDMATDILAIMNSAGFLIGLAVMALSVYTATLARRAEYGVLKALGARSRYLYGTVVVQALIGTGAAFGLAMAITLALGWAVPGMVTGLELVVGIGSLLRVAFLSAVIAALAALLPIRQIAGLDPATIFREGSHDMTSMTLEISGVTKRYGDGATEVIAVRDVSLAVAPGEVVLIMGPSGSGKTTLVSLMGALLKPTEGSIRLDGTELSALSEGRLPDIRLRQFGFIFQDFNLLSALSVLDNVAIVAELAGAGRRQARERARALLVELGLGERLDFLPEKLSGGEKQRVAIARALVNDPALILADEPTANLDSKIGHEIMRLLHDVATEQGRSVVIVSHDQRIRDIADRILWLEDGAFKDMVTMATDPACGMAVERERAITAESDGEAYFFCSRGCREEFLGRLAPRSGSDGQRLRHLLGSAKALIAGRS